MTNTDARAVLARAAQLQRLEAAALALPRGFDVRAGWAAALAALITLIPSVSAAQLLF